MEDVSDVALRRGNLRWEEQMTRAKLGLSSKMAVPKRVAQKRRRKLGPEEAAALGGAAAARLGVLQAAQRERRRHHLTKQLQAATKKAKGFLVRKLLRRGASEQLRALRALPLPVAVAAALASAGLAELAPAADAEPPSAEWAELARDAPQLCSSVQHQLLGAAAVRAQLDKLREASSAPAPAPPPSAAEALHPSWAAKKQQEGAAAIRKFEGKKITFG